jgi:hypothetical protein
MVQPAARRRSLSWTPAILTGLPLVAVGLTLLTGSIVSASQIVFFSVVCTLGIGALFWLGLALVLGLAILYAADQLSRWRGRPGGLGLFTPAADPAGGAGSWVGPPQALSDYAARRLAEGADRERVRRDLLHAGWTAPEVEAALRDGPGG